VPYLSGACLCVRRAGFEALGGFAERFFLYHEDLDLSLRLRLMGGRLGLVPDARVRHDYEFEKGAYKWRLMERNRWWTLARCWPTPVLIVALPLVIVSELALLLAAVAGGWAPQKLAAIGQGLAGLPRAFRERGQIQRHARISAGDFARWLTPDLSAPQLGAVARLAPLRWALRGYWSLARRLLGA
jgi:N-acetylglucosaminyl-diphospho-decaprenol L-rhamnosyltransferase